MKCVYLIVDETNQNFFSFLQNYKWNHVQSTHIYSKGHCPSSPQWRKGKLKTVGTNTCQADIRAKLHYTKISLMPLFSVTQSRILGPIVLLREGFTYSCLSRFAFVSMVLCSASLGFEKGRMTRGRRRKHTTTAIIVLG